jgi:hypothetical protein
MSEETVNAVTDAHKMRAWAYYYLYKEMENEFGKDKASEIFKNATYKMGQEKAAVKYSDKARENACDLCEEFVEENQINKSVFSKSKVNCSENKCEIEMHSCPLIKGWQEMGLNEREIELMCDLAYQVDFGTFDALGYDLSFSKRLADGGNCCHLILEK